MKIDPERLDEAYETAVQRLLEARDPAGGWRGELSTSALSTATATVALSLAGRAASAKEEEHYLGLARGGLNWLARHANADGGWGDTVRSRSNVSTTTLAWAAFHVSGDVDDSHRRAVDRAEVWLRREMGALDPGAIVTTLQQVYGEDRTFSAPILTHCALCGRLGAGAEAWQGVIQLPFELAACPRSWFPRLGLPVVSYALPALIAIGLVRHHHRPSRRPVARFARALSRRRVLRILEEIQPSGGGFLEAVPLTSFVVMSLVGAEIVDHPVTRRGLEFLERSVRGDGSWPIDSDLAMWVTTLSLNALSTVDPVEDRLDETYREALLRWILAGQFEDIHPYTLAAPGGWAWTDLPGGVPDSDDTAGAVLALRRLAGRRNLAARHAAAGGIRWLVGVQNGDGGIPTFCRGWGRLPFDRSCADITAHAVRAWLAWTADRIAPDSSLDRRRLDRAVVRALEFLESAQREDGSWLPLWFGNEQAPNHENPVYGTSRVLGALRAALETDAGGPGCRRCLRRGLEYLVSAQNPDGSWGGAHGVPGSVEETALAVEALAEGAGLEKRLPVDGVRASLARGVHWLIEAVERGALGAATPIGFYFASLWYFESLYPAIFTVGALGRARRALLD